MSFVWDSCISCGKGLPSSNISNDWRKCSSCSFTHKLLRILCITFILVLWSVCILIACTPTNVAMTFGLTLDIWGAWLLANGFSEMWSMASGGFGGGEQTFQKYGPKSFKRKSAGVLLLMLGFLIIGLASILKINQ